MLIVFATPKLGKANKKFLLSHITFSGFLFKDLRGGVWRTRDLNICFKNPTELSFANIGNQILFLYFQESLGALANSLTDKEKSVISREYEKFIKKKKMTQLGEKYLSCTKEEQKWILDYLSTGKGTIRNDH